MSITQAEKLKVELTDKWVIVAEDVPELRRFADLTGKVKTVNMNCRALVEFDDVEDISWYDIDPQFLTVVDGPRPKKKEEPAKPKAEKSAKKAGNAAPAGNPLDQIRKGASKPAATGGSPLDAIRAGSGGAKPAASKAASPLDAIRAQASGGTTDAPAAAETESAPADPKPDPPAEKAKPAAGGSPLDQIRSQGGFKG